MIRHRLLNILCSWQVIQRSDVLHYLQKLALLQIKRPRRMMLRTSRSVKKVRLTTMLLMDLNKRKSPGIRTLVNSQL